MAMTLVALAAFGIIEHIRRKSLEAENHALRLENFNLDAAVKMHRSIPFLSPTETSPVETAPAPNSRTDN